MAEEQTTQGPFNKGETAPQEGNYVCVPCGFHKHFKEGESFSECTSCLSGTPDGKEEFAEGLEMWETEIPELTEAGETGDTNA